jgi:RNase P subunit RPR2
MRIEIEDVKKAHTKVCAHCCKLPRGRRLKVVEGTARSATTLIYCHDCGWEWLEDHRDEVTRAMIRLNDLKGDQCVRKVTSDD